MVLIICSNYFYASSALKQEGPMLFPTISSPWIYCTTISSPRLSSTPGLLRRRGVELKETPRLWRTVRSLGGFTQPLMGCLLMFFSVMVFRPFYTVIVD